MVRKSKYSGPKYANGNYKSYQKKYDASPLQIRKRSERNKENKRRGTYGNGDGQDNPHKKSGGFAKQTQSASKNRSYNGHGKRSRYSA